MANEKILGIFYALFKFAIGKFKSPPFGANLSQIYKFILKSINFYIIFIKKNLSLTTIKDIWICNILGRNILEWKVFVLEIVLG